VRLRHVALLLAVFAGLLTGCGTEQTRLSVTATDYGFTGVGGSISGGQVEVAFSNEGKANHELAFVDIGNTPFDTFKKEFPAVLQGKPFPSWLKRITGAGEFEPEQTATTTITLPKGKWLMMCALDDAPGEGEATTKPHYELGMYQTVDVAGPEDADELPETEGGTFHAKEYTFEAPSGLSAGEKEYAFVNDGPNEVHFMTMAAFPKGTTAAQAESAFGKLVTLPENAPPPAGVPVPDFENTIDTFVFSAGMGQTFTANFKAGVTYVAACFIQDRAGGPPHAIGKRMYKAWTVK
jgi:hypothetical protein